MATVAATERGSSIESASSSTGHTLPIKASLLLHGVHLDESALETLRVQGHWLAVGVAQQRLELQLAEGFTVTPLVHTSSVAPPVWTLVKAGGRLQLRSGSDCHSVTAPPPPSFYGQSTSSGRRIGDFAQVYGSTLVLGGRQACGYSISGIACRFCRVGSRSENERSFGVTAYEAAEATSLAFRERALQYVFLPAASFDADDGGVQEIEPLVKAIRRHTSALVLAALHPPRTLRWIDHAYAIGVDGISFNLEVPNVPSLERLWPGRARYIGRSRYLQALRHAGKIFPRGTVWTELLLGACPVTELSELIEELISWNVLPFFVPTHPLSHSRTMPLAFSSSSDEATALLHQLQSLLLPNAPPRPWLPAWPHLLGPLDLPATEAARTNLTKRGCLKSRLELLAVRNLARLRRSLRVRCLAEHEYEGSG